MKKYYYKPTEAWNIHENAHEPVIDELDYELVQELMAMDTRIAKGSDRLQLFSGLIQCGVCGQPMTAQKTKRKPGKTYINYICSTHKKTGECQNNNISETKLGNLVLCAIQQQIDYLITLEDVTGGLNTVGVRGRKQTAIETMIERNMQDIKANGVYLVKSWEQFCDGVISETEYQIFKKTFNSQIQTAEDNITFLRDELSRIGNDTYVAKQIERLLEHRNITELTRRTVVGMIKSIVVNTGKDIDITFRYTGEYDFSSNEKDSDCPNADDNTERTVV